MHILTHYVGETIMIGENVAVTVLGVHGTQVRIGVYSSQDVAVNRQVIFERIEGEQQLTGTVESQIRCEEKIAFGLSA